MKAVGFIVLGALVVGAGAMYYYATRDPAVQEAMQEAALPELETLPAGDIPVAPAPHTDTGYSGTRLAGDAAPLLDFTKADFAAALAADKLIVLYFYANWCPICREEFPKMEDAFNELTSSQVVGFRVNFNDSDTDADEVALAREHGVAYQHTKVFVKSDTQILKSPETWEKDRYLTEIKNALAE